ncbi:MAG: Gfo/Idh/MocA family oxidoreductase [Planctomycetaceae bacterium]
MTEPVSTSRRHFLAGATAAAAAGVLTAAWPGVGRADDAPKSPGERIQLGVIGIGPRCTYDLKAMLQLDDVRCVAIADVQQSRRDAGKALVDGHYGNSDLKLYRDFRELLARDDIDAVLIATGDRWHGPASILAAEAGKDVYSEKPCGITIDVCQRLADTIDRTGRVFQAGTQRRSVANFKMAVDMVHSGKLGKVHTLHASIYRPVLDNTWLPGEPTPAVDVVDWNMWLGPAAWRPFNQQYVNGRWRGHWDFDSGAKLLDWGAHTLDLCQWANNSDDTMPIEYVPSQENIVCTYANGVKLVLDFLDQPFGNREPHYITRLGTCPVRFEGEQGSVETGDEGEIVCSTPELQKELGEGYQRVRGLDVATHARNFFDCMRTRQLTNANQHVMRRSHIACHAAATAWVLGRPVKIDPKTEQFIDDPEANMLRQRPEREWAV